MHKFEIKNRYGLKIVGNLSVSEKPNGCAFVLHGLGGRKEQSHLMAIVDSLFSDGYTVVNFDATNSIGESEGKYENATFELHYEDLVDVIVWAKGEAWYQEPFILAGHSMGAYAVAKYAEEHPNEVESLFAFAPVISGKLSFEATERFEPGKMKKWKETGWTERVSHNRPGLVLHLPWSHMEERLKHDLEIKASNLTMPVLLVVGELDGPCPPEHQKLFLDMLPAGTKKELQIVPGAPHTFREREHLDQLRNIFYTWLKRL